MPRERFARGLFQFNAQLLAPCPALRFLSSPIGCFVYVQILVALYVCSCICVRGRSCGLVEFSG